MKYVGQGNTVLNTTDRKDVSNAWKGITRALPILKQGIRMLVNNGRSTRFWEDSWLEERPLEDWVNRRIPNKSRMVSDMCTSEGEWKWDEIRSMLPEDTCNKLEILRPTMDEKAKDEIYWKFEGSGKFSVTSAYYNSNVARWNV